MCSSGFGLGAKTVRGNEITYTKKTDVAEEPIRAPSVFKYKIVRTKMYTQNLITRKKKWRQFSIRL